MEQINIPYIQLFVVQIKITMSNKNIKLNSYQIT